ncbi:MAG: lipid-A-disaccharide synthase N-terminal domain-containing protein [Verrucomicrobia bacterium]|nr:lipid-A-disaccharide synthase N-terminal domain-containing protein [Verrucomicrobiota bacterium]
MLVQWIASEKARASVIPVEFWWLSLVGSTMIVIYFVWRVELVGILGQATGWFVYVRNLWFIHTAGEAPKPKPDSTAD